MCFSACSNMSKGWLHNKSTFCNGMKIEPQLQQLNGEIFSKRSTIRTDDSRADVAVRCFWMRRKMGYADVGIFNLLARCHRNQTLQAVHRKKPNLQRIINVIMARSRSSLFSCYRGMSYIVASTLMLPN